jgi:hypothetical protein
VALPPPSSPAYLVLPQQPTLTTLCQFLPTTDVEDQQLGITGVLPHYSIFSQMIEAAALSFSAATRLRVDFRPGPPPKK